MAVETLTRAHLSESLVREVGLSRNESANLVDDVLSTIIDALSRGENTKLAGFGTFMVRAKKERVGRNPKTGVAATISARHVLTFRPSHILKKRVNGDVLTKADLARED